MKSVLFYVLLYLRPIQRVVLGLLSGLCWFVVLIAIFSSSVGNSIGDKGAGAAVVPGITAFVFGFVFFVLRQSYDRVLLKLQPEGTSHFLG